MALNQILAILIIITASSSLSFAGPDAKSDTQRTSIAFSNPKDVFPMPDSWVKMPVAHEEEFKDADVVMVLDQDVYQTLLPLIDAYAKQNKLKIAVKEGTCGIAAGMLMKKTIDMGGYCCPVGKEDRLPGMRFHTLGIVSKAFLVNPTNTIDNISSENLRELYRGKIFKWSELRDSGGNPGPDRVIKAIGRLHCGKRPGHWKLLLDKETRFSPRMTEVGTIPDMLMSVSRDKDAIGWEVMSMVEKYKSSADVKPLKIDGSSPLDSEALAKGKYPYYRVYTLSTWSGKGLQNNKADRLVEYLIKETEKLDPSRFGFAHSNRLRKAGWRFLGDELIGEPK